MIRGNSLRFCNLFCRSATFARENILVIREIRGEIPDSAFKLLSFFNARIRKFVGDCELAVKDAIYQELSKKLEDKGLRNFVLILDNFYGVSLSSNGV